MFTFGSDPEFMIFDGSTVKSAIGVLPKKEDAPDKNGYKYYYDNVLAEIAVKPASNREEALSNTKHALGELANLVSPVGKIAVMAATNYPKSELKTEEAKIAGCNPEWSVYTLEPIEPPKDVIHMVDGHFEFKVPFRTAGGHIHLGNERYKDTDEILSTIRMMDLFIGIPSIFLDTDETSKARRKAYGLAGSHRVPDFRSVRYHGLEYRPLSNFWFSSPVYFNLVYDLCEFVTDFVEKGQDKKFWSFDQEVYEDAEDPSTAYKCFGYDVKMLKKCINTCDKKLAEKFMLFIGNYMPSKILQEFDRLSGQKLPDLYKSWGLK